MTDSIGNSQRELQQLQTKLAEFEAKTENAHRLERLQREHPNHPLVIGMRITMLASALFLLSGTGMMVATFAMPDLMRTFAQMPVMEVLPTSLIGLGACSVLMWGAMYGLALQRGSQSPRMPRHLAEINRIRSEIQRLKAAEKVAKRLSETPPPIRRDMYPTK